MKRVLAVLILICCSFAPSALACVACRTLECSYEESPGHWVVTTAPRCTTESASPGYSSCRDVANCGGCMGWTCYADGIIDGDTPAAETTLVVVETKIEVQTPEKN